MRVHGRLYDSARLEFTQQRAHIQALTQLPRRTDRNNASCIEHRDVIGKPCDFFDRMAHIDDG